MRGRNYKSNNVVTGCDKKITLENGYSIAIRKEKIPAVGRSIYRGIDEEQVVMVVMDTRGEVTNRFAIPQCASHEVAEAIVAGY